MSSDKMKRQKALIAHLDMLKERESKFLTSRKEEASKPKKVYPQDRKYKTKGSNYKPGRAVRKKRSGE
tara:strand:- start:26 stop:229 length:204 start_codon:yes stop_codon:yes gene_type:complete